MSILLSYENATTFLPTEIILGREMLLEYLNTNLSTQKSAILLTDETVWKHYESHWNSLHPHLKDVIIIPDGEPSKTFETANSIAARCITAGVNRDSVIIGFGGGVVTDLCGFVASILLRGIDWIAVPTTIIGAVDAAIGGKTGVNLVSGKNLVGTFHPSRSVLIDTGYFNTLTKRDVIAGWGEIVKYGLLTGGTLWKKIESIQPEELPDEIIVELCIKKKVELVAKDLYDRGERRLLNLGHTAGHALEAGSGFDIYRHGEAVLWGLGVSSELSNRLNYLSDSEYRKINNALKKFAVPRMEIKIEMILPFLATDKKRVSGKNRWILLRGIGDAFIADDVPSALIEECLVNRIQLLKSGKVAE